MTRYAQNGGLTRFDEGKSHQENALGGIPIGNNNSVEENETKSGNFVYSNRIFLDNNTVSQYNLPKSLVGKSIADATKFIDNKFKGRNDKISQSTKDSMLSKIAEAQESMKPQEPEVEQPQEGIEQQGNPEGTQDPSQMALGGYIKRYDNGGPIQLDTSDNAIALKQQNNDLYQTSNPLGDTTNNTQQVPSKMGTYGAIGIAAGDTIGSMKSDALSDKYKYNPKLQQQDQAYDSATKAVASVFPVAGLIYGAKKGLLAAGEGLGGEKGRNVATGLFDPSAGQRETLQSKDSTQFEKGVTLAAPFLSGVIAGKARERTRAKYNNASAIAANNQFSDQYAYGGPIDDKLPKVIKKTVVDDKIITPTFLERKLIKKNTNIAAYGGELNKMEDGGDYWKNNNPYFMNSPGNINPGGLSKPPIFNDPSEPINIPERTIQPTRTQAQFESYADQQMPVKPSFGQQIGKYGQQAGKYLNDNAGNLARYAPIAMNAYQLSQLKKPQGERLNRLENRYKPSYVDIAQQQNIVNQELNNTNSAIQESGASQGASRNAILGAQLNKTKALSNAYMNAQAQNAQQDATAQQFNLGVDQTNLQQSNNELDINDRNSAAYRNEKSKYLASIGNDIGDIGKEQVEKKIIANSTGYKWDGEYVKSPEGKVVTDPDTGKPMTAEKLKQLQSSGNVKKQALGGYLIKNKKYE